MTEERNLQITNKLGLHVRPSTALAELASHYKSSITLIKDGRSINAKSSIELLTLAAIEGTRMLLRVEGEDAKEAADAIEKIIQTRFGED